jgi:hypothetical protein
MDEQACRQANSPRQRELNGLSEEETLGTSLVCEKCGKAVAEERGYEHLGRSYCEDCYMDILSPPKACDPWAVYAARTPEQGADKLALLTPLQRRIVDFVKSRGEATAGEVMESLNLTEQEFRREFVVLRHMEILKGSKKETGTVYKLFDA